MPGCTPFDAQAASPAANSSGSSSERIVLPLMNTLPAVCCIRIDFRPNWGIRLITFFDPGRLNGFQDLLVGGAGIVLEIGQFDHPTARVREPHVDVVRTGMALLELDRDVLDTGPTQLLRHLPHLPPEPTCRPSCCGLQQAT